MSHLTPPQPRVGNRLDRPDGLNSSFRSRAGNEAVAFLTREGEHDRRSRHREHERDHALR